MTTKLSNAAMAALEGAAETGRLSGKASLISMLIARKLVTPDGQPASGTISYRLTDRGWVALDLGR